MSYTTIYRTTKQNQMFLLKGIFEQNNIDYRFLEESDKTATTPEMRVEVKENDKTRAEGLLRENGFVSSPARGRSSVSMARFWLLLVIGLIFLIIASILINYFMG